jgi:5-methylcytosine-specific restriction endonuclease McrA
MARGKSWHTPEYKAYLQSDEWAQRRRAYFRSHGYRCEACGIRKKLTVHHVSYEHLGNEPDEDLRALCWRDHRNCHEADNSGRFESLAVATEFIIERGRRRRARRERCSRLPLVGWAFR